MSQHIGCLRRGETQLTIQSHRIGRNQEHAFVHTVQIQALQAFHARQRHIPHARREGAPQIHHRTLERHTLRFVDGDRPRAAQRHLVDAGEHCVAVHHFPAIRLHGNDIAVFKFNDRPSALFRRQIRARYPMIRSRIGGRCRCVRPSPQPRF